MARSVPRISKLLRLIFVFQTLLGRSERYCTRLKDGAEREVSAASLPHLSAV